MEIIHINICGPFTSVILGGYKYFITFIDHLLVMDIFFSYKKNLRLWICSKIYKAEIELKKEKIVRSGRGGEFYDRYSFKGNIVDHCIYL